MAFAAPTVPSFPAQPLDMRVELELNNAWTDVSPYVFMDTTSVQRGHPDESTTASPSAFSATVNNADGRFSSTNPLSPYYGSLSLNTPLRVSIPDGSSHLRLENDNVSYAQCAAPSGLSFASGFQIVLDVDLDSTGVTRSLAGQWGASGEYSWAVVVSSGRVYLFWSQDGTSLNFPSSQASAPLPVAHGRMTLRIKWSAGTLSFYYSLGAFANVSTWVQLPGTYTVTTPFVSTAPIQVGYSTGLKATSGYDGMNGKLYSFVLTNAGATLNTAAAWATADFTGVTAGATSFTDAQGNAWSLQGTSEVSNRDYRFHGVVSAWPQTWTPGDANVRVALTANGLLRRLGTSQASVQSALFRAYSRSANQLAGYWPCEDPTSTVQVASGIGGPVGVWSLGVPQVASSSAFACSAALPVVNGATLTCPVPRYANIAQAVPGTASDAVVRFLMAVPSGDDTNGAVVASVYYAPGGSVARVDLVYGSGGSLAIKGYNSGGSQVWSGGPLAFGMVGKLARVSIELRNLSSGIYNALAAVQSADGSISTWVMGAGSSPTSGVSGLVTNVTQVVFNPPGGTALTATAIGHVTVESVWTSLYNMQAALAAYVGESAVTRFTRLCGEEGIACRAVYAVAGGSALMGPQTQETIATLLQECADVDRGMWFEPRQVLGFGYRTRVSIGNQPPALVLDYDQDQLSTDINPTLDDQTVHNDITVTSQQTGSTNRQTLDDGSAYAIGTIGRYDTTFTVNTASDNQLADEAGWILHASTVNEPRYTALPVDLANTAVAGLWFEVLAVDAGDRIQVLNPPAWLPPGAIDQVAQGFQETLSLKALNVSWNSIPDSPYNIAYLDQDPNGGANGDPYAYSRCDTDGSAVLEVAPAGQAFISVANLDGNPPWTWYPSDFPFDVTISGERVAVDAVYGCGVDGSFEVPSASSQWQIQNSTAGSSWTLTNFRSFDGTQCAEVMAGAAGALFLWGGGEFFCTVPGYTHTFTAQVWGGSGTFTNFTLGVLWYDGYGAFMSTSQGPAYTINSGGPWQEIYAAVVAPAGAVYGAMYIGGTASAAGAYFYLDAVYPAITSPQLVLANTVSGNFESGLSGWVATNCSAFVQTNAQAHNGSFSAQATVATAGSPFYLRAQQAVVPGATYTACGWVRPSVTVASIGMSMDFFGPNGYITTWTGSFSATAGVWTPVWVTFTAPEDATSVFYGPTWFSSPASGSYFYADDITLVATGQTFFVNRAVNGVSKSLPVGSDVRLSVAPILSM